MGNLLMPSAVFVLGPKILTLASGGAEEGGHSENEEEVGSAGGVNGVWIIVRKRLLTFS